MVCLLQFFLSLVVVAVVVVVTRPFALLYRLSFLFVVVFSPHLSRVLRLVFIYFMRLFYFLFITFYE